VETVTMAEAAEEDMGHSARARHDCEDEV
jgi:hypothetical protein